MDAYYQIASERDADITVTYGPLDLQQILKLDLEFPVTRFSFSLDSPEWITLHPAELPALPAPPLPEARLHPVPPRPRIRHTVPRPCPPPSWWIMTILHALLLAGILIVAILQNT